MYVFLAVFGGDASQRAETLARAQGILEQVTPSLRRKLLWQLTPQAGPVGSWLCCLPQQGRRVPLVSSHTDDQGNAVLLYGELNGDQRFSSAAEAVSRVWQTEGLDAVRLIDGSFAAILVSRDRDVTMVSDTLGRRILHYFTSDGQLFVSAHDIPLVATGRCRAEVDLASVVSVLATDWSVGGHCLLSDLSATDPMTVVHWKDGSVSVRPATVVADGEHLEPGDTQGCRQLTDEIIEHLCRRIESIATGEDTMEVQLTAGIDSRAGLSAMVSALPAERLKTVTIGTSEHFEVRQARRVARHFGISHHIQPVSMPSAEGFLENVKTLAFYRNGELSAVYAVAPPFEFNPAATMVWGHGGGEIFRSYYYTSKVRPRTGCSADTARSILRDRLYLVGQLPWQDPSLPARFVDRHSAVLDRFASMADNGSLIIDLYYIYERFARWMLGAREPQEYHRYFTLESPAATRTVLMLPRPLGRHNRLHAELIRRNCLRSYWFPVNGWELLPLRRVPGMAKVNRVFGLGLKALRRARSRLLSKNSDSLLAERARVLGQGDALTAVRQQLGAADSLGIEILGRPFVDGLLQKLQTQRLSPEEFNLLGFLITLEEYRGLVNRVKTLAGQSS